MGMLLPGVAVLLLVWSISTYNRMVQAKHSVRQALSNIDVLLRQRHDELPKLVETCRQYKQFEQDTLEKVILARSVVASASARQDVATLGQAEGVLRTQVGRIFAVAEAYPELRADGSFAQLQARISALEEGIADRRELYNQTVNTNNVLIEQFPGSLVASLGRFAPLPLLSFEAAETADVNLGQLFADPHA
ncbi:MAG: LemA family protein [Pseudomonadota bacterium]|nr:LemA family protein [Pseudomonadota bacterium]